MSPEEKLLLDRTLKLSEDNNRILKKLEKRLRWAFVWGLIKLAIILVPLVIGILYLEPYLGQFKESYAGLRELMKEIEFPL